MSVQNIGSNWVSGNLVFFIASSGVAILTIRSDGWLVFGANDVAKGNGAGAPTDGAAGTGVGVAGPGSEYTDYSAGKLYINTNTKVSPLWTPVGAQTT
jgi:hypothetical protein